MADPVSLEEAKFQCHMENDDSRDSVIEGLIPRATARVARITGFSFTGGAQTAAFSRWGNHLELWRKPVASVEGVTYGADGTGSDYEGFSANLTTYPVRLYAAANGSGFPVLPDGHTIIVSFTTGDLDEDSNEYQIAKQAILLLIGYWFNNDGEIPLDKDTQFAFDDLINELRPISAY